MEVVILLWVVRAVIEDDLIKGKEIAYMAAEEIKNKINKGTIQ